MHAVARLALPNIRNIQVLSTACARSLLSIPARVPSVIITRLALPNVRTFRSGTAALIMLPGPCLQTS